jgi:hypothetical protein
MAKFKLVVVAPDGCAAARSSTAFVDRNGHSLRAVPLEGAHNARTYLEIGCTTR